MSSFSMGRYIPYDSFLHRLDPRVKILSLIFLMVALFLPFSNYSMTFTMLGLCLIVIILLLAFSRISLSRLLSSLKSLWFMLIFLLLIYALTPKTGDNLHLAFNIGTYPIYFESLLDAAKIMLRLMLMIALSLVLTATTKPLDLTYALEWYLTPLKFIGFPAHVVAMIISLALRFIPTILDDVERILKAQSSRGVDFEHGKLGAKFRAIVSLIVPLFVSSFIRSDELANAMECRGYDPSKKRTRFRILHFSWVDLFGALFSASFLALFIYCSVTGFDAFSSFFGILVW